MYSRLSRLAPLVAVPLVLALTGCDRPIDTDQLQDEIAKNVKQQVGVTVKVTCPKDVDAKKGKTFDCLVKESTGAVATAKVTLTDDKGGFAYDIVAGAPAGAATTTTTATAPPAAATTVTPPPAATATTPPAATPPATTP